MIHIASINTVPLISSCITVACERFGVQRREVLSHRRARSAARARQTAMWLARNVTPHSLPEIGQAFVGRDHTTVMHAIKRIEQLRATDPEFRALTDRCMHDLTRRDENQVEMVV